MADKTIKIGRRVIEVSNIDKPYFPAAAFTKGDLLD